MPIASVLRRTLVLIGFALSAVFSPSLLAQDSSGESPAADGFDPNPIDGNVIAIAVQQNGMILIAGTFTELRPKGATTSTVRPRIARLFPDGRVDTSFYANISAQVNVLAVDATGNILVGGRFTQVNHPDDPSSTVGVVKHLVRLNSTGALDSSFTPNCGSGTFDDVTALTVQDDGKILVGGGFSKATGAIADHLVRLNSDGSQDTTFTGTTDGYVMSISVQQNAIYIGGSFLNVSNKVSDTNTQTYAQPYLARLDPNGKYDASFTPVLDNTITSIAVQPDGKLVLGGYFTSVNADTTHPYFTRINADGSLDTGFFGTADGGVSSIHLAADGRIYLTGAFSSVSGAAHSYAARVYANGEADSTYTQAPNGVVYTMAIESNGSVLLGGMFTALSSYGVTSITRNHLARVTQLGALDTDLRPDLNGRLRTVYVTKSGQVMLGGSFTSVGGATHGGIVRLNSDGKLDSSFTTQTNGTVIAILELDDGSFLIGGSFSEVDGVAHAEIARVDKNGALVTNPVFDVTLNGQVNAIVQQSSDKKIIIGGAFTAVVPHGTTDASTRTGLVRLNTDGTLDTTYDPEPNNSVSALVLQPDGKLVAGGSFTSVQPNGASSASTRYGIARFETDGKLDSSLDAQVNGTVFALALQSDGSFIVGGSFQLIAEGTSTFGRGNIARLSSKGVVDPGFDPQANNVVDTIVVQSDGKILVGGFFDSLKPNSGNTTVTTSDGTTTTYGTGTDIKNRTYITRLTTAGAVDDTFDLAFDRVGGNGVAAIVPFSDHYLVAGAFTSAIHGGQPTPVSRLVQVDSGGVPSTFADLSTASGGTIYAVTTEINGTLITAGNFSNVGGTRSSGLAAFYEDGTPQVAFSPYVLAGTDAGTVYSIGEMVNKGAQVATQRAGFARIDSTGNLDTSLALSDQIVSGTFDAIAIDANNKILLGGSMTLSSGSTVGMMRLTADGSVDSTYTDLGLSVVEAIAVQNDGKIVVGGSFSYAVTVNGTTTTYSNLLRLNPDGTMDTTFKPNPTGAVQVIVIQSDGTMLIGGSFTSISPVGSSTITARNYIAKLGSDGTPDSNFNPDANSTVDVIQVLPNGKILIGGSFTTLQPNGAGSATTRSYLALLNTNGTLDSTDFGMNGPVYVITAQSDNSLLVGGSFSTILGQTRNNLARLTYTQSSGALAIDSGFNPNPNAAVAAIAIQSDGLIVIGGGFTALTPNSVAVNDPTVAIPRNHIARLEADGTPDASFNPNLDGAVSKIVVYGANNALLVTGAFTSIQPSGSLIVGGKFDTINSVKVTNLALFSTDGSVSSVFQPNPNDEVDAILPLTDDRLIIAGKFTQLNGVPDATNNNQPTVRNRIARFNADNSLDTSYNPSPDDAVYAVGLQADGKVIVGGAFTKIGGQTQGKLARLLDDGTVDTSFAPSVTGTVHAVIVQSDGKVLALYGDGTDASPTVIARFMPDGSGDSDFTTVKAFITDTLAGTINTMALQADGKILVGGSFNKIGGGSASNFARVNSNGTLDTTLTASPNGPVTALTITADGKIVLGGSFTAIDGLPRFGLARLAPTEPTDFPSSTFEVDDNDRTRVKWTRKGVQPELNAVVVDTALDGINYLRQGQAAWDASQASWILTGVNLSGAGDLYIRTRGVVPNTPQSSNGLIAGFGYYYMPNVPVVTGPTSLTVVDGAAIYYAITASNNPTSYVAIGLPSSLSLDGNTGLITGSLAAAGSPYKFKVQAANSNGVYGPEVEITITVSGQTGTSETDPRIVDLSVLSAVSSGHNVVAGFVVKGSNPLNVYTRAIGPSLATIGFSSDSIVTMPRMQLLTLTGRVLRDATVWAANEEEAAPLRELDNRLGATPKLAYDTTTKIYTADSAFVSSLASGPYSIVISAANNVGGSVLAEIYDASQTPYIAGSPRLANISARGQIDAAHYVSGGFVINGAADKKLRVLIRGIGQTLATQGVPAVVTDTHLDVYEQGQVKIASNENWGDTPTTLDSNYPVYNADVIAATAANVGAFALPAGSKDAAIVIDLPPGIYSAVVTGPSGSTGEAMVEIYDAGTAP